MTIFRTINYRWKLLRLKSGKRYIRRELTSKGLKKWMEAN